MQVEVNLIGLGIAFIYACWLSFNIAKIIEQQKYRKLHRGNGKGI
jgi:hypothetical protein